MKPPNSRFNQTHCLRTAIFFISDTSISLPDGQGYETQPCNKQQKQFTHNNQGTKVQIAIISHEIITLVLEESGHLSCLKWARENGCPWNELTCKSAASGGHLSCLQWARENGCEHVFWICEYDIRCSSHLPLILCPGADKYEHLLIRWWGQFCWCKSDWLMECWYNAKIMHFTIKH